MDDLEGEVIGEKVHKGGLGEDIFSADLNGEDSLLTNIREYSVRRVADNLGGLVGSKGVRKGSKAPLGAHSASEIKSQNCILEK